MKKIVLVILTTLLLLCACSTTREDIQFFPNEPVTNGCVIVKVKI